MGVLVVYPATPDYRPTQNQVDELVSLLRREQIIGDAPSWATDSMTWNSGSAWDRMGIPSYSMPMTVTVHLVEPLGDDCGATEDWELTLAQQHFRIHIQDVGVDDVDRSDPIWSQMEQAVGSPLAVLYFHM